MRVRVEWMQYAYVRLKAARDEHTGVERRQAVADPVRFLNFDARLHTRPSHEPIIHGPQEHVSRPRTCESAREREQMTTAVDAIATAAAVTLGQQPNDFGPRAFAAATFGVLQTIRDSQDRDATPRALDRTFTFLRADLDALRLE